MASQNFNLASPQTIAGAAVASGFLSHFVFKRFEPPLFPTVPLFFLSTLSFPFLISYSPSLFGVPITYPSTIDHWIYNSFLSLCFHSLYLTTLFTSIVLYRISPFHPLAKFPGPRWARVSKLWGVGVTLASKDHEYMAELHEKYGDWVRIGPNELSIKNANAINPVLGTGGFTKGPFYDAYMKPKGVSPMFIVRTHGEHVSRRKVYDRGFTPSALGNYLLGLAPEVQDFVEQLGKRADGLETGSRIGEWTHGEGKTGAPAGAQRGGNVIDLNSWIGLFAFDFMGELLFGKSFDMKKDGDVLGLWKTLETAMSMFTVFGNIPWLTPILGVLPVPHEQKRFQAKTIELVNARKAGGGRHKDLCYYLMAEDKEGGKGGFDLFTTISELNTMIVAGSDTAAGGLVFTLYYILSDPEVQKKLLAELDSVVPPGEHFPFDDHERLLESLSKLPYLNACILEGMRLQPPVPMGLQRTSPSTGADVGGTYVPPNTQVGIPTYALQRDARYFSPDPESFRPERWLNQNDFTTSRNASLVYHYGPYACAGKHLANHELRLTISALLHQFDFKFPSDFDASAYLETVKCKFVLIKGDLPLVIQRRKALKEI